MRSHLWLLVPLLMVTRLSAQAESRIPMRILAGPSTAPYAAEFARAQVEGSASRATAWRASRDERRRPSADSAAVALELEMSRLLSAGRIDEYAAHLTADYARTTRQGRLERRDAALASWRARGAGAAMRPTDLWVRVYGDAAVLTGAVAGGDTSAPRMRITKTFVRLQGRWLLAALHSSGIAER